jgi:single-stranded DNA-specific DHH superfamily exonuclease
MLTKKQIKEIQDFLENSQNPLFFFDNDQDGLCSFLILRRYLGRGKGFPVKAIPMPIDYFRKVKEFEPDCIFFLDQPEVSAEFFEEVRKLNIPMIMIDHHDVDKNKIPKFVNYYNPFFNRKKSSEPTTFLCYQILKNQKDDWLALVGCISDKFVPPFYKKFLRNYPDLAMKSDEAFDIYYNSSIGKIAQIFNAGLKDTTTNVMLMLKFLINAKTPYDVLVENKENSSFHNRFKEINKKYLDLIDKAKSSYDGTKILYFNYSGEMSMSADLSNRLSYLYPGKIIIVAYVKGGGVNISVRGKNIKNKITKIISKIDGASGGGHNDAIGAKMNLNSLEEFIKEIREEFENPSNQSPDHPSLKPKK